MDELDGLFTQSELFTSSETNSWAGIKTAWAALKSSSDGYDTKSLHVSDIIDDVNKLVIQVADVSNLTLDPDVDSYYLITVTTTVLPELIDRVGRLQSAGIKAAKSGSDIDNKSKIDLAVYTQSSSRRVELVNNNLTIAFNSNPELKARLSAQQSDYGQNINNFFNNFSKDIYHPENISATPEQINDKGLALNQSISRFYSAVNNELKTLLQNRIDGFNQDRLIKIISVAILLLIVFVIGYFIVRYIITSVNNVNSVLSQLGEGNFKNKIELDGTDELAVLRRYLQSTQVKLNADVSNAKEQAVKATRIMQALDNVQSCVMMADNNLDIIFMNKSILEMFKNAQDDIRTELPNFDVNRLMGVNIDQFHKNPAHQRGLLSNLKSTFNSNIVIGGRHLNIVANPVTNDANDRLGIVVEWTDRTREVKVEQEIEEIVDSVKIGRLDKRLALADKQGFFAKLSEGINELTDVIERVFKDVGSTMESMSEGDLTNRITSDYQGVYLNCKNDINATIDKLSEIFSQVNESANFINNSSQEIASGNNNLSQRAEQQAANLQETAASMEELTSTVKNNADNAQQANLVASNARELAEKGGNVVTAAVKAMQDINESSNKIADIISVIDEIAFQTNLLALNASVEAARAGEQGRGFSVVATEVRNLAQRSATAARESKELIQSSVQKVRAGSEFVNQTGTALNEIVAGVKKVGDIVAGIAEASVEQSAGIAQVNQAVSQMDEITQQNAALAEQASAASVSMSDLSTNMVELLSFFKLESDNKRHANESRPSQSRASAASSASSPKNSAPSAVTRQATYKSSTTDEEWQDF
ncbi:MAG: chemotaxis protein [Methylomonas sp.]|nr:MAG: chemotaxis protein [Methylomonas sp.]